jgi:iron complex outermembrane receptor protein
VRLGPCTVSFRAPALALVASIGVATTALPAFGAPPAENAEGADDETPPVLVVQGSAAPSFASTAREGKGPRDTPDAASLLEDQPGVHVRRQGAEGGFATVSIRGNASNQVAVTFAGVPMTGAADPSLDLATLPLWPGAALRVHRTFAPAALGGGYLGGVVAIEPLELTLRAGASRTEVYDAYGSYGSYRLRASDVRAVSDEVRVGAGVTYARWDGGFTYWDPSRTPPGDRTRENAEGAQLAGVAQVRVEHGAWSLLATGLAQARRDGVPGAFDTPTRGASLARDRELVALEARRRDDEGRWLARAFVRREGRTFRDDAPGDPLFRAGNVVGSVLDAGVTFGRSHSIGAVTLDARLEFELERAQTSTSAYDGYRRARSGVALDATLKPVDRLTLIAAARADLRDDADPSGQAAAPRELLPVAHVGGELVLFDGLSFAAHAGALARSPSFLELLGDGGTFAPSPKLKSERSLAADAGLRARWSLFEGRARFEAELTGFVARTSDFIVVAPKGYGTLGAVNVGEVRTAGGEATLAATIGPVRLLGSYTALYTRDATDEASYRGRPLPGRPPHDLTLDATVTLGRLALHYGFDFVAATSLDRADTLPLPARTTHDVGARVRLGGGLTLLGEIRNLFDQRTRPVLLSSATGETVTYPISDYLGYPMPGRRFTIALRWSAESAPHAP